MDVGRRWMFYTRCLSTWDAIRSASGETRKDMRTLGDISRSRANVMDVRRRWMFYTRCLSRWNAIRSASGETRKDMRTLCVCRRAFCCVLNLAWKSSSAWRRLASPGAYGTRPGCNAQCTTSWVSVCVFDARCTWCSRRSRRKQFFLLMRVKLDKYRWLRPIQVWLRSKKHLGSHIISGVCCK